MSNGTSNLPEAKNNQPSRRSRLWLWFLAGTLIVFLGMAVACPAYFQDGRVVMRTSLWHYYALEIERANLFAPEVLGPTTGSTQAAVMVALEHILISIIGGVVVMGIAWVVQKLRRSP